MEGIEGYWMLDILRLKVLVEGMWTVSEGVVFQSFTICGKMVCTACILSVGDAMSSYGSSGQMLEFKALA